MGGNMEVVILVLLYLDFDKNHCVVSDLPPLWLNNIDQ
jgi:hypothetical protein